MISPSGTLFFAYRNALTPNKMHNINFLIHSFPTPSAFPSGPAPLPLRSPWGELRRSCGGDAEGMGRRWGRDGAPQGRRKTETDTINRDFPCY